MLLGTLKRRGGRAALWLVVGLLIGGAAGAATMYVLKQGKKGVSGGPRMGKADELDLVPGEASGFVHIRLRGLWDSESFAEVRKIIDAAGPQAKAALDESFVPAPSTLDRMTLVFLKVPPSTDPKGKVAPPPAPGFGGPFGGLDNIVPPALGNDVKVVTLLAFNAPFDQEKVRSSHAKNAATKKIGDREYLENDTGTRALYFPNNTTMAIGDGAGMRNYLVKLNAANPGPLAKAIEHARDGGRHFVAALNMSQLGIPLGKFGEIEGEYKDAAKHAQSVLKAECVMLGVALTDEGTKFEIRAKYKDDATAGESESALRELAKFGRTKLAEPKKDMERKLNAPGEARPRPIGDLPGAIGVLMGLGSLNALDDWLADPPLKTDGNEVVLTPKIPSFTALYVGAMAATFAYLMPAIDRFGAGAAPPVGRVDVPVGPVPVGPVGKVQGAAARLKDSSNLKQIGIALHSYHDANAVLPAQDGRGGLSWRVYMLPYLEQEALYKQFKLDEPWDSENNKPLADKMPAVFASPLATDPPNQTRYKVFTGKETPFVRGAKVKFADITDGLPHTIMVAGGGAPVIWTKPDDIEVTPALAPAVLALPGHTGCNVLMCDGSVRWTELNRLNAAKLKALITRDGNEALDFEW